jgi:hypothetical protein
MAQRRLDRPVQIRLQASHDAAQRLLARRLLCCKHGIPVNNNNDQENHHASQQ